MLLRWTNTPSYNPWREIRALQRQMDDLFRDTLPQRGEPRPPFNVSDLGDKYLVEGELPGVGQEDLQIDATVNTLTIKGQRSVAPPEGYSAHRQERSNLEFSRSFTFEDKLDLEKVAARLEHGLLRIELAKQAEVQPRTITVKVG